MLNLFKGFGMLLYTFTGNLAFLGPIVDALNAILIPLLIVVATAGTIYAVVLGVNMARAEDADKRAEAKKRVINAVVALAIMIILILLLQLFASNLGNWFGSDDIIDPGSIFIHLL
jgi:Na+-driven multidrug efflux pump